MRNVHEYSLPSRLECIFPDGKFFVQISFNPPFVVFSCTKTAVADRNVNENLSAIGSIPSIEQLYISEVL